MNLSEYFDTARGKGVLATADASGYVNAAVYAKPHFLDENTVAFIMAGRLTYDNLKSNPHAAYVFFEEGGSFTGKRLYLSKIREDTDTVLIDSIRRSNRSMPHDDISNEDKHLVTFRIDRVLPLVGQEA
jgi:hypothetical protein